MNDNEPNLTKNEAALAMHDRQVQAIMTAVAKMLPTFGPQGFTPESIFEGAVKGAAVAMMAGRNVGALEISDLLAELAAVFRENPRLDRG